MIFVAADDDSTIFVNDLGDVANPSQIASSLSGTWDLQYSNVTSTLIQVFSYALYNTNIATGKAKRVGSVPDGPGYPRINALSPDGTTLAIFDFSHVFTMDVSTGDVGPSFEFHLSPRAVGMPRWVG